ncbi:thioredoxin [Terrihabitans soli]|uniref:Thioredoxin n=1 Tax=Terrihabitans soli TaxID=708113 RepID=A0A6S6QSB1_9HYPH|nr:thioredoxin [Terrihabitans soli]BCJ89348.1 thioredoxin [Terrihabitans soli]
MAFTDVSAPGSSALVKDTTTKDFGVDVVQESRNQPVLVDFWAPWCGPCTQLGPIIEKAVREAGGKVKLVKMNTDEHPTIAGQLGIKSLPSVIAFVNGQPVDGFVGAQPESQIKAFIDKLTKPLDQASLNQFLDEADQLLAAGDLPGAAELFGGVLAQSPNDVRAMAGLIRVQLQAGDLEGAKNLLASIPPDKANDPALAAIRAQIELADNAPDESEIAAFEAALAKNANDHQARHDLAAALAAAGRKEEAVDHLLTIIRKDRNWNEDGARKQLVQLFEAWGPTDEWTVSGRRRLSSILFS